ncbi:MAG: hypothetical protein NZ601_04495, partial [candidate division WOR-3 bacterium]|nr:hypothetical protein [candidate division WOR-3 bacterium]MDW7988402.1 hypothetical protein [candidate division WOR-3 bacterium]
MRIVILGIGASGIIAQFVLVRELLVNFNGNEFSLGFILGSWLLAEALGAYSARHIRFSITNYRFLIFLFGIIFPVTVGIVKIIRPITSTLPGEIFTLTKMLLVSFAMISPVSFIHGMLFTGSSEILVRELKDKHKVSGYVYSLENLGTIIGGVIFSLFLLPRLSATLIALSVSFMNTLLGVFISKENNKSKYWWAFIGCVLLGLAIGYTPKFEKWALTKNFPYYNVLGSLNTHYSNVTIVMREDQQTFYIDGMPTINIPNYDRVFIEEFVNFPLLTHNNPEKILIIGGGIGGVIKQLITCNIKEIVYVESD